MPLRRSSRLVDRGFEGPRGFGTASQPTPGAAPQASSERYLGQSGRAYGEIGGIGRSLVSGYQTQYAPFAQQLRQNAFISPETSVGQAATDVRSAFGGRREAGMRNLSRMGVNPNSGRWGGLNQQFALAESAALAGAMNRARLQGREENFARALQVLGVGQNELGAGLGALGQSAAGQYQVGEGYSEQAEGDAMPYQWQQSRQQGGALQQQEQAPVVTEQDIYEPPSVAVSARRPMRSMNSVSTMDPRAAELLAGYRRQRSGYGEPTMRRQSEAIPLM